MMRLTCHVYKSTEIYVNLEAEGIAIYDRMNVSVYTFMYMHLSFEDVVFM